MTETIEHPVVFGNTCCAAPGHTFVGGSGDEDVAYVIVEHTAPCDVDLPVTSKADRRPAAWAHIERYAHRFFERCALVHGTGHIDRGRARPSFAAVATVKPRIVDDALGRNIHGEKGLRRSAGRRVDVDRLLKALCPSPATGQSGAPSRRSRCARCARGGFRALAYF